MKIDHNWTKHLEQILNHLISQMILPFSEIKPSKLPQEPGVYLITMMKKRKENALYIGRTTNLQQRLYNNHLMGPLNNARLKKYLINDSKLKSISDKRTAKQYIRNYCQVRWIIEKDYRLRGAYESYFTSILFPKYGISLEH